MGVKHEVLNAKNHEREASIVAQAGRKDMVTVSTNMAGRGTDILLGGNPEFMTKDECLKQKLAERLAPEDMKYVADAHFYYFSHHDQFYRVPLEKWNEMFLRFKAQTDKEHDEVTALGGLHIVATERHESRRIDNQLRGRAGRQGDPGSSRFFLSLQDDLLRIFGGERMQNLMRRLGMEEDVPIESKLITKRIAKAQEAVEMQNFEARKHLLEYDDVNNKQRQAVYGMRRQLLEGIDQKERIMEMVAGHHRAVRRYALRRGQAPGHVGPLQPAQRYPQPVRRQGRHRGVRRTYAAGDHRPDFPAAAAEISGKGRPGGSGCDAADRAHRDAAGDRQPVERPPAVDGRAEAGYRQPGLRPEGSAGRIQEGRPTSCSRR